MIKQDTSSSTGFLTVISILDKLIGTSEKNSQDYDKLVTDKGSYCEVSSATYTENINKIIKKINETQASYNATVIEYDKNTATIKELETKIATAELILKQVEASQEDYLLAIKENSTVVDNAIQTLNDINKNTNNYVVAKAANLSTTADLYKTYLSLSKDYLGNVTTLSDIANSLNLFTYAEDIEVKTCNFGVEKESEFAYSDLSNDFSILLTDLTAMQEALKKKEESYMEDYNRTVQNSQENINSQKTTLNYLVEYGKTLETKIKTEYDNLTQLKELLTTTESLLTALEKECDDTIRNLENLRDRL